MSNVAPLIDALAQVAKEEKREKEYQALKAKIEKEFPIRKALAKLLGRKLDGESIHELFVEILIHEPSRDNHARMIIRGEIK